MLFIMEGKAFLFLLYVYLNVMARSLAIDCLKKCIVFLYFQFTNYLYFN